MLGTVLAYRDDGTRPHCEIALGNGDRVQLALDSKGLVIERLGPRIETLFQASPKVVSQICAGLVGPKGRSDASPLRILAAVIQRLGSAADVRAAFADGAARLNG
jgi:hypothetical protein